MAAPLVVRYRVNVSFDANGGTGAPSNVTSYIDTDMPSVTVSVGVPDSIPTRSGYTFNGWAYGSSTYAAGSTFSNTFTYNGQNQALSATFYARWTSTATPSTWGTVPTSVQLDGTTEYTFNINKSSDVDHHTIKFTLGSKTSSFTNVGTSQTVHFNTTWQSAIPDSTSGTIVVTLTSYTAGGAQVGTPASVNVTGNVPSSVVPTLSISTSRVNTNATVSGWDILLQGYSKIQITATAAGAGGSTVRSIAFSGPSMSKTGAATTATSNTITVSGSQTWTVVVTDSRGRTATQTYTESVYEYSTPSVSTMLVNRCDSDGTLNPASGTSCKFRARYATTSVIKNSTELNPVTVKSVETKLSTSSTWTTVENNYTSYANIVLSGTYDVDKQYDVRITVTDTLGNTATATKVLSTVSGFSLGLKNDRARFGGVPTQAGLQIDWRVYAPKFVQSGTEAYQSVSAGSYVEVSKTFDSTFPTTPNVIVSIQSNNTLEMGNCSCVVNSISSSGFKVHMVNNSTQARNIGFCWIAVL